MKQKERFPGNVGSLEEEMANYSSILACKIPCTEEPGRPQSMGSQRVRRHCAPTLLYICVTDSVCCTPEANRTL